MLSQTNWKYYNHALIPTTAPHEDVNVALIDDKTVWNIDGHKPLFARWTSCFDCGYETEWWYCIKDNPFNIEDLKAKRRYEINRGNKYFDCKIIEPVKYKEDIYKVQVAAVSSYRNMSSFIVEHDAFFKNIDKWKDNLIYGAFYRDTGELCAYAYLSVYDSYANLNVLKANPEYEKYQINAALIYRILNDFNKKLEKGFYIIDGERNVLHETAFQDYLEKYFGFRKAYCKLHIKYRTGFGMLVKCIFPLRNILKRFDNNNFIHNVLAVLKMEDIRRKF